MSYPLTGRSAIQPWVFDLSVMQQSVLISAIRNEDGTPKGHPQKDLMRWYRRCVLISAFDGCALTDPAQPGGGSFTGPVENVGAAADAFIRARDGMTLHYYCHAMHAFQILGAYHPNPAINKFWQDVYERMAHALHLWPETVEQMARRLSDDPDAWREREDPAGGCST